MGGKGQCPVCGWRAQCPSGIIMREFGCFPKEGPELQPAPYPVGPLENTEFWPKSESGNDRPASAAGKGLEEEKETQ